MLNGQARTNSLLSNQGQSLSWFRMRAPCATGPTLHQDDTSQEEGRDAQLAEAWRQNPREREDWCPCTLYLPRGRAIWATLTHIAQGSLPEPQTATGEGELRDKKLVGVGLTDPFRPERSRPTAHGIRP